MTHVCLWAWPKGTERVGCHYGDVAAAPTPFFGNKNRAFWRLQFLGWIGALLLRGMSSLANAVPWSFLIIMIIATITGFSISLILSVIYRALINRRALVTWG